MKTIHASLFLAACLPAFAQKAGDTVTPDALGKAEWVTGAAPAAWEPGKLYVLECWATWCGPCIAAIPHVDALYDKYREKGLRVIGVNVWEDGKAKVAGFVEKKGDGMSYPVAYVGKGGDFENTWLKPAEVRGIPHAFVVKDGKVLLTTHPMQLTEPVIEGLLAGGEAETKVLESIREAQRKQEATGKAMQAFRQAAAKKDIAAIEAALAELKQLDPASRHLPALELEALIAGEKWEAAEAALGKLSADPLHAMTLTTAAQRLVRSTTAPESFRRLVADRYAKQLEKGGHAMQLQILAKLQWANGDKEAAVATARRIVEQVKSSDAAKTGLPVAPFEKFAAALENGEMPADEEVNGWLREAMPNARAAAPIEPKAD